MANRSKWLQNHNIVSGIVPVDLNDAATTGDYISLKNYEGVVIVVYTDVGTVSKDVVITLQQSKSVADADAKDLLFTDIYHKSATLLTTVSNWTHLVQTAATSIDTVVMLGGAKQQIVCIEIKASQLDTANDFDSLRVELDDLDGAKHGCAFYIMYGPRVATDLALDAITA